MRTVTVLVVDDFVPFREAVCELLAWIDGLNVIAVASDGLEAVQKARMFLPDLILLDVGLPKVNGIDGARYIRKVSPASKILFLTQESSTATIREAFRIGALGYLLKSEVVEELFDAVDAVLRGKQYFSRRVDHLNRSA